MAKDRPGEEAPPDLEIIVGGRRLYVGRDLILREQPPTASVAKSILGELLEDYVPFTTRARALAADILKVRFEEFGVRWGLSPEQMAEDFLIGRGRSHIDSGLGALVDAAAKSQRKQQKAAPEASSNPTFFKVAAKSLGAAAERMSEAERTATEILGMLDREGH